MSDGFGNLFGHAGFLVFGPERAVLSAQGHALGELATIVFLALF